MMWLWLPFVWLALAWLVAVWLGTALRTAERNDRVRSDVDAALRLELAGL